MQSPRPLYNKLDVYAEELLAPCPTPKLEDQPLVEWQRRKSYIIVWSFLRLVNDAAWDKKARIAQSVKWLVTGAHQAFHAVGTTGKVT
jgi:hypothetical protein